MNFLFNNLAWMQNKILFFFLPLYDSQVIVKKSRNPFYCHLLRKFWHFGAAARHAFHWQWHCVKSMRNKSFYFSKFKQQWNRKFSLPLSLDYSRAKMLSFYSLFLKTQQRWNAQKLLSLCRVLAVIPKSCCHWESNLWQVVHSTKA